MVRRRSVRLARFSLWRRQDGSAITEFALIVPIFFLVVYAVLAFGQAYQRLNVLTGALRDGARYASTQLDPCAVTGQVRVRVGNYASSFGVVLDVNQVNVTCGDGITVPAGSIAVGVSGYALFSDLTLWGLNAQTVTRAAVFRCEREAIGTCGL